MTGEMLRRSVRLTIVDLAGSERQERALTQGLRLREASSINKSLSTLGQVVKALVAAKQGKSVHIPYRDNKLTFLLKDSLEGHAKIVLIVNISPEFEYTQESLSTLTFATNVKGTAVAQRQDIMPLFVPIQARATSIPPEMSSPTASIGMHSQFSTLSAKSPHAAGSPNTYSTVLASESLFHAWDAFFTAQMERNHVVSASLGLSHPPPSLLEFRSLHTNVQGKLAALLFAAAYEELQMVSHGNLPLPDGTSRESLSKLASSATLSAAASVDSYISLLESNYQSLWEIKRGQDEELQELQHRNKDATETQASLRNIVQKLDDISSFLRQLHSRFTDYFHSSASSTPACTQSSTTSSTARYGTPAKQRTHSPLAHFLSFGSGSEKRQLSPGSDVTSPFPSTPPRSRSAASTPPTLCESNSRRSRLGAILTSNALRKPTSEHNSAISGSTRIVPVDFTQTVDSSIAFGSVSGKDNSPAAGNLFQGITSVSPGLLSLRQSLQKGLDLLAVTLPTLQPILQSLEQLINQATHQRIAALELENKQLRHRNELLESSHIELYAPLYDSSHSLPAAAGNKNLVIVPSQAISNLLHSNAALRGSLDALREIGIGTREVLKLLDNWTPQRKDSSADTLLDSLRQKTQGLEMEKRELQCKNKELEERLESAHVTLREKDNSLSVTSHIIQNLKDATLELQEKQQTAEKEHTHNQQKLIAHQKLLSDAQARSDSLAKQLVHEQVHTSDLEKRVSSLQSRVKELTSQLEDQEKLKKRLAEQETEMANLKMEVQRQQEIRGHMEQTLDVEKHHLRTRNAELEQLNAQGNQRLLEMEQRTKQLEMMLQEASIHAQSKQQTDIQLMEQTYKMQIRELESRLEVTEAAANRRLQDLKEAMNTISSLESRIEEKNRSHMELLHEAEKRVNEELQKHINRYEESKKELAMKEVALKESQHLLEIEKVEKQQYHTLYQRLLRSFENARTSIHCPPPSVAGSASHTPVAGIVRPRYADAPSPIDSDSQALLVNGESIDLPSLLHTPHIKGISKAPISPPPMPPPTASSFLAQHMRTAHPLQQGNEPTLKRTILDPFQSILRLSTTNQGLNAHPEQSAQEMRQVQQGLCSNENQAPRTSTLNSSLTHFSTPVQGQNASFDTYSSFVSLTSPFTPISSGTVPRFTTQDVSMSNITTPSVTPSTATDPASIENHPHPTHSTSHPTNQYTTPIKSGRNSPAVDSYTTTSPSGQNSSQSLVVSSEELQVLQDLFSRMKDPKANTSTSNSMSEIAPTFTPGAAVSPSPPPVPTPQRSLHSNHTAFGNGEDPISLLTSVANGHQPANTSCVTATRLAFTPISEVPSRSRTAFGPIELGHVHNVSTHNKTPSGKASIMVEDASSMVGHQTLNDCSQTMESRML